MSITAGDVVGGWRVVRFVGEGRSGAVFEVRHAQTCRRGALKALCGPAVRATKEDFARESDFVARQPAPGDMPAFYGGGTLDDGTPFFVMEFIEMLTLDVRTGLPKKLPRRQTLRLFKGLARILLRLHANGRGHLHCDIKPENIGWRDDEPVLVDFGCARTIAEARQKPTRVGSWEYMAPEVREARCLDERADIYSLGVTLGKLCNRQSRRTFETLILHATANDPNERPQTAADFLRELKTSKDRLAKLHVVTRAAAALLFGITATVLCGRLYQQFSATSETAALRHAEAETEVGVKCYLNRDFTNAVEHLERAVETQGYANPEAYGMLADCYRRGRGTEKDLEKSRRYATLAAERGDERGKKVLQRLK